MLNAEIMTLKIIQWTTYLGKESVKRNALEHEFDKPFKTVTVSPVNHLKNNLNGIIH